jgi:hypothetical protein
MDRAMERKTPIISFIHFIVFSSVLIVSSFFKVSFIIGSKNAFFCISDLVVPVASLFGGAWLSGALLVVRYLISGIDPLLFIFKHMPGLCGALYLSSSHKARVLIPLLCIVIFCMHPTGSQAFLLSAYWLIPVAVYRAQSGTIARVIGASFMAHAVGSVVWLYTVPMAAWQWNLLIPIVWIERLVYALGMWLFLIGYSFFNRFITSSITEKLAFKKGRERRVAQETL